jgi:16S rRNA G1207 methylase RsmC
MLIEFENLKIGNIDENFIHMIKPANEEHHQEHIERLRNSENLHFGFKSVENIYQPSYSSSSIFLIRNLFRMNKRYNHILDLGTGTGFVGLTLKMHNFCNRVTLADIDEKAILCAKENTKNFNLDSHVEIIQSNVFGSINQKYDAIIFNLPLLHSDREVTKEELALNDYNGEIAKNFFINAHDYLNDNGEVIFTYSNISNPLILQEAQNNLKINLIAAEFFSQNGLWFFLYSATKK